MNKIIKKQYENLYYYIDFDNKKFVALQEEKNSEEVEILIPRIGRSFPFILFIGEEILPQVNEFNSIHLLPIKKRSVELFYRLKNNDKKYRVSINIKFILEVYPIYVHYSSNLKFDLKLLQEKFKGKFDLIVYSTHLTRIDLINLRLLFPTAKYVLAGEYITENIKQENWDNYRITDIAKKVGEEYLTKNPVYASRLYLRKLDFDKMYNLPLQFNLSPEEINIILTYLDIMFSNQANNKELSLKAEELKDLKIYFEFVLNLITKNIQKLEEYIEKNDLKNKNLIENIYNLIKKFRENNKKNLTKEEDIQLWQLETVLNFKTKEE